MNNKGVTSRGDWIILGIIILFLSFLVGGVLKKDDSPVAIKAAIQDQPVLATTLGWKEITSMPIPVVTTNKHRNTCLSQVKFGFGGDGPTYTALIVEGLSFSNWKIGDKVLVLNVPGKVHNMPTPTFIVVDHRLQEQKK
jgi:hypothetical protein